MEKKPELVPVPVPVLVTTQHGGVFAGLLPGVTPTEIPDTVSLEGAKMAICFGTTKGVLELAETGPTKSSRVSAPADVTLNGVTMIARISEAAWAAWEKA